MDFTKSGIPGISVTDSFADVKQRLDIVREDHIEDRKSVV